MGETGRQYWLGLAMALPLGAYSATPSINLFFNETSSATNADRLTLNVEDGDTTEVTIHSSTTPGTSTAWQHVAVIHDGTNITMYVDGSSVGSASASALGDVNVSGNWAFGSRVDTPTDRYLGGSLAEWAKWDRALNATELANLAAGNSPLLNSLGYAWHVPMWLGHPYEELIASLTVTNNGTIQIVDNHYEQAR